MLLSIVAPSAMTHAGSDSVEHPIPRRKGDLIFHIKTQINYAALLLQQALICFNASFFYLLLERRTIFLL